MGGFIRKLVFLLAAVGLGSFAAFDDPVSVYKTRYDDTRCKLNDQWCPPIVSKMILPGVSVLFIDQGLATREGRRLAVLTRDWPYCDDKTGEVFLIPRNFETDFASIPGWAQFYVKPSENSVIGAALVHDWLYAYGGTPVEAAKKRADELFRIELKQAGVNVIKRNIMFQAVSRFGGKSFGQAQEMRFRDPQTGALSIEDRPSALVVDQLGAGCGTFYEKYWRPEEGQMPVSYGLDPRFIQQWIPLPGL